jgi:membrane protease YdiL (CAAX protease family)
VLAVVGFFSLAAFLLWLVRYWSTGTFELFGENWPLEPVKYWRRLWWASFTALAFGVPLAVYARWILGVKLRDLGFSTATFVRHLPIYLTFIAVVLPLVVLVSFDEGFRKTYPMAPHVTDSWPRLLGWELVYAVQFFGVEAFFRGYLIFGAARTVGIWGAVISLVPYVMIHFSKPAPEAVASIIAGVALGWAALKSRSIWPGLLVHVTVAWSMDLLALWQKGSFERLFG